MDAALVDLVRAGKVTLDVAQRQASVPEELMRLLGGGFANGHAPAYSGTAQ
jgi:hypothetical protein